MNDFILNVLDLREETVYLFSLFHKYNVEYAVVFLGNIPSYHLRRKSGALNILEYMSIKIDEAISAISRLKLLLNMFKYFFCIKESMPFPRWFISSGHFQLWFGKVLRKPFYTTVIKTHSFDIDTIKNSVTTLRWISCRRRHVHQHGENVLTTCVVTRKKGRTDERRTKKK